MEKFKFKPDKLLIGISALVLLLLLAALPSLLSFKKWYWAIPTGSLYLGAILLILRTPLYATLETDRIRIKRIVGSTTLQEIEKIEAVAPQAFAQAIRTFGNGGFFGYTGFHYAPSLGHFYLIALNRKELAKITLKSGKVYLINYPKAKVLPFSSERQIPPK